MKIWKKLLALTVCVLMVVSLSACSMLGSLNNPVLGAWVWEINMTDLLEESLGSLDLEDLPDKEMIIYAIFEFSDNGILTLSFDKEASAATVEAYMDDLVEIMVDYMYGIAESSGMTRDQFDELCESQYGSPAEEYIRSMVDDNIDTQDFMDDLSGKESMYYKVDGNKIYLADLKEELAGSDSYIEFTVSGSNMTFSSISGDVLDMSELEDLGVETPIELVKK